MSLPQHDILNDSDTSLAVRDLGHHERLLYLYSKEHPRHFCVVANFVSSRSPWEFVYALHQVQGCYSILNVSIREAAGKCPAFHRIDQPLQVTVMLSPQRNEWQAVVEAELARPFPVEFGPLVRATVLQNHNQTSVIITMHHAIADAVAATAIFETLMKLLNGEPVKTRPVTPSLEALVDNHVTYRPDDAAVSALDPMRFIDLSRQPLWRSFEGDKPRVYSDSFDCSTTSIIRQVCRTNGVSLNGALCAAVALAHRSYSSAKPYTIACPINLRAALDIEALGVGLYVSVGSIALPPDVDDFWTLAKLSVASLKDARTPEGASRSLNKLGANLPFTAGAETACGIIAALSYDAVISNLGQLQVCSKSGDVQLTELWGPFVQGRFKDELVIGAATLDGVLRVSQSSPFHIEPILEGIRHHIQMACT